ncbi:hypothetical protein PV327_005583 [Microctonus hyperodae]|uniref:Uncharacterized protein n=1 Tax=Microctonus hyperodae TaxID=165561 RepID=A0AA39G1N3_MICHY|nr:hypothetical protein PV327_005583 [Microctonus hyperodae]
MSGDRGLCVAVHSGIAKAVSGNLENKKQDISDNVKLICVGEKNCAILSRIFLDKILWVSSEIGKKSPTFSDVSLVAWKIIKSIDEHVELSARMIAMDGATKNATEMIKNFTLKYNRTKQAVIIKELIEIISEESAT